MENVLRCIRDRDVQGKDSSQTESLSESFNKHITVQTINESTADGITLLSYAVNKGHLSAVDLLLGKGANPNVASQVFDTLKGVWRLETPLITAARLGMIEVVIALVEHGAMVNAVDPEKGKSPLHWACAGNFPDAAKYLLRCGASVALRDYYSEPPVVEAISHGDKPLVQELVFYGVKLNEYLSNDRDTALLLALLINQSDIAEFLMEAGATVNVMNREYEDAMWAVLTYCKCESTALHLANKLIAAGFIVKHKHLNKAWNKGAQQLHQCLKTGWNEVVSLKNQCRLVIRKTSSLPD